MATADFVTQLFQNMFGRAPSAAEITLWTGRIDTGVESATQVALDLLNTQEGANAAAVERLYQTALGRTPDLAGFKTQVGALSVLTLDQVAQNFVTSPEFQSAFVGTGPFDLNAFVTRLYHNILGRDPDAAGFALQANLYNSLLASGKTSIEAQATLLQNFANSAEFTDNKLVNLDKTVLLWAGIDNAIPVSTSVAPNALLQQAASLPLATVAAALNDGVNGDGFHPTDFFTQIRIDAPAAGTIINGTAGSDVFDAVWAGLDGTVVVGGGGYDILSIAGPMKSANVFLSSVEEVAIGPVLAPVTLTLGVRNAPITGQIDTLTLAGGGGDKTITIAAPGVENIVYDANAAVEGNLNFTGSTALANLSIHGPQSFTVAGFAGDRAANLTIDASAATGFGSIDARTYSGTTGVTIFGSAGGTGYGELLGSANADHIVGGKSSDIIAGLGGADILTAGSGGNDLFLVFFDSRTEANDSSVSAFDTITDFARAPGAEPTDHQILISDAARTVMTVIAANAAGSAAGTTWSIANGVLSFTGGAPITTLAAAIAVADAATTALGAAVSFQVGGDSYLFEQNGTNDVLIKLAGLTGIASVQQTSIGSLFVT